MHALQAFCAQDVTIVVDLINHMPSLFANGICKLKVPTSQIVIQITHASMCSIITALHIVSRRF